MLIITVEVIKPNRQKSWLSYKDTDGLKMAKRCVNIGLISGSRLDSDIHIFLEIVLIALFHAVVEGRSSLGFPWL